MRRSVAEGAAQPLGHQTQTQTLVAGPELGALAQGCGGQQMHIDPAYAFAVQRVARQEGQHLAVLGWGGGRQVLQ